jgi:chromosomal replication initiator protein
MEGGALVLGCPNPFFLSWIRDNYLPEVRQSLRMLHEQGAEVTDVVLEVCREAPESKKETTSDQRQLELPDLDVHTRSPLRFNPRFTFDRFIVGATNQYAFAAANAMARGEDLNTNSLFLLSEPGLGKSHLSQAIGQFLVRDDAGRHKPCRVYYLTAEDFTNEMVYSIKHRCVEEFKDKYRKSCDVLVLEEVHFLSGKEKVQAELTYALDCLVNSDKRVVLTSSCLPKDIPRLGRGFASRLSNSLISTISPPDFPTRLKIMDFKAREKNMRVDDAVLEYMAGRLKKDVRQMESCLNSLGAKSRLLKRSIDMELARETLKELVPEGEGYTPEAIRDLVCRHYQVSVDELVSPSRRKNLILPRNMGMYLCRKMTDLSLQAIGRLFGRNHSTVLHSVNMIENRTRKDARLKGQVDFLSQRVKEARPN